MSSNTDSPCVFDKPQLPKLAWVSPMQRRRLSPFTKMALHCAYEAGQEFSNIDVVFSSRHGDLHKTSTLLDDLAEHNPLSPTAFSMSVHNASAGLLSILTRNKSASNTVSAGRNTFMMALIDAYARLCSGNCEQVLLVHCEQALPSEYLSFQDEKQIDHAIAFVMEKNSTDGIKLSFELQEARSNPQASDLPIALQILEAIEKNNSTIVIKGSRSRWNMSCL